MNENKTNIYELVPRIGGAGIIRTLLSVIGLLLALIGVIMMFTIVMFIPGIFTVLVGLVVAYISLPKNKVVCRDCGTENSVQLFAKGVDCEGCKERMVLRWKKSDSPLLSWSALFNKMKSDKKDG